MMRQGLKKLISAFLIVGMVVTSGPALKAQAAERRTDYFEDREHAELTYEEMRGSYYHYDPTAYNAELQTLKALTSAGADSAEVKSQYEKIEKMYNDAVTLLYIASNEIHRDVTDQEWSDEYMYLNNLLTQMNDNLLMTLKEAVALPGGSVLKEILGEDIVKELADYEKLTDKQLEMANEEEELVLEYQTRQVNADSLTVAVNGLEMTNADLVTAYMLGILDYDNYYNAAMELSAKKNEYLGDVYIRLVELRKQVAAEYGYDNYGDLRYESYGRDYTQESIQKFADAVKEYIAGPYLELNILLDSTADCLNRRYDYKDVFKIMNKYIPEISSEVKESLDYLQKYELYDLEYSEKKTAGAYTGPLPSYNSAFIYSQPYGNAYDFSGCLIHEFGHFNSFYYNGMEWYEGLNLDIAEVHSQGLETLFLHYYDEIFGDDADTMREFVTSNLLGAYVEGCMINELETYVYATDNVTLTDINKKFLQLAKDYGILDESDSRTELYNWSDIPHVYQSPCYYISYATSVATAFDIWELSTENFEKAADAYLEFVSYGFNGEFTDMLEDAGLGNPLKPESVKKVGEKLNEYYDLEARMNAAAGQPDANQPEVDEPKEEGPEEAQKQIEEDIKDNAEEEPVYQECYVRAGDTLAKIGSRYQADWKEIAKLNQIKAPYKIYAGDKLLLPEGAVVRTETYQVQAGDTLGKIAAKLGMDWRILAEKLGMKAPYTVYEGQKLQFTY